jgi:hypothetical protein
MRLFSRSSRASGWVCIVGTLAVCLVLTGRADNARADSLQQLLEQVGSEYAEAYASPFIHTFGPNQNSNLFSTAHISWTKLTFGIGVKAMATNLNEADQTFQKVVQIEDLGILDPVLSGQSGTAVMSGPTIFGDTETDGKIDVYANGVLAGTLEGIPGFWDTRWVPLATPEVYVGGLVGLKFTLRYLPPMEMGDFGKTQYLGYGLSWNANGVLKNLPIDIMAGFFLTSLDVENTQGLGQDKLVDSEANSYFLAISKSWPAFTVYGGFAIEDSNMKVAYYYEDPDIPNLTQDVSFNVDGRQKNRFTVGVTLDVFLDLNVEAAFGDMSTYSAGLMFGF